MSAAADAAHRDSLSDKGLVHIAPAPILARLEGLDDRVLGRVEMLSGVAMGRGIAAADMAAGQAQAQMHPGAADPQAILAARGARRDGADCFPMRVGPGAPGNGSDGLSRR